EVNIAVDRYGESGVAPAHHRFVACWVVSDGGIPIPYVADVVVAVRLPGQADAVADISFGNEMEIGLWRTSGIANVDVDVGGVGADGVHLRIGIGRATGGRVGWVIHLAVSVPGVAHSVGQDPGEGFRVGGPPPLIEGRIIQTPGK